MTKDRVRLQDVALRNLRSITGRYLELLGEALEVLPDGRIKNGCMGLLAKTGDLHDSVDFAVTEREQWK